MTEPGNDGWPRAAWRIMRRALIGLFQLLLALILLFEEWGWRPLAALLGRLRRFRIWERMEEGIESLPPYAALCVFALPSLLFLPLKLAAVYLVAKGQAALAGILFVAAKVFGTALVARIFILTRPALMRIGWFARVHDVIVPWHDAIFARIRASWPWRYGRIVKERVRRSTRDTWTILKPRLEEAARRMRDAARGYWRRLSRE
jgi:hypothetical protein